MTKRLGRWITPTTALILLACSIQASAGIIGHWNFDENSGTTVHDSVGTANLSFDGTPAWTSGITGSGLDLGGGGINDVQSAATGIPNLSALTLSVWFNASSWPEGALVYSAGSNGNLYLQQWGTDGEYGAGFRGGLRYWDGSTDLDAFGNPLIGDLPTTSAWHNAVITYDGSNSNSYFDGNLIATGSRTGTFAIDTLMVGNFNLGAYPVYQFHGIVDEMQLYNVALDASQIHTMFENPGTTASNTSVVPAPSSFVVSSIMLVGFGLAWASRRLNRGRVAV